MVMVEYLKLSNHIFFLEGENKGRYPFSNSMLLEGDKRILIDTGIGPTSIEELIREKRIDLVLISHGHEDHIVSNPLFEDAEICCHKLDAPLLRSVRKLEEIYGSVGTDAEEEMRGFLRDIFGLRDSRVDFEFEDGCEFELGSLTVKVIHTPGHSAGHCCFYIPSKKMAFIGDVDLTPFGPWYGGIDSDIDQFLGSIERIKELQLEVAVTSHRGVVRGRKEISQALDEFARKIFDRERRLLELLNEERGLDEIVNQAIIYGKFPHPEKLFKLSERIMIEKHLQRLIMQGKIECTESGFKRI